MIKTLSIRQSIAYIACAFIVRAVVFIFFIQPNGYYKQADSMDYHSSALSMALGKGMYRIDSKEPIFWRTPGYPAFLGWFYEKCGVYSARFEDNSSAQIYAIWFQIALSSFIPLIFYVLCSIALGIPILSNIIAWIAVFHPGLILASSYLLTEGLALFFFYLFLLFLFAYIFNRQQQKFTTILAAVCMLTMYTWMRPMGEFIGYASAVLIAFATIGSLSKKLSRGLLFGTIFFATLFPWYLRNFQLTGEWFFCPTIGTYLNCFSVPKILRRTLSKPIEECHRIAQRDASIAGMLRKKALAGSGLFVSNNCCKEVAYPIIASHPGYFMYDWIMETVKTTFDLYCYQLVAMNNGTYWYDPIEEWLPDKITECLWSPSIPWYIKLVSWIEAVCALTMWIGLISGFWIFVLRQIIRPSKHAFICACKTLWLYAIPLIGIIVGMTGGFGYARLRLPAEPLMILLSMAFWYWYLYISQKESLS